MKKNKRTGEQKKLDTDLCIIVLSTVLVLSAYMAFQSPINGIMRDKSIHVLLRLSLAAAFQFGLAGLGITIVSILRKEPFGLHGLNAKGTLLSIALCVLSFVPYTIFALVTKQFSSYLPLQSVWTTREVLSAGFPTNAIGMLLTATAWGFFEGFNYVVISDKINKRYPSKNRWLNWGAICCAVICILIHGAIGVTLVGVIEMVAIMVIIYGMLIARDYTGNAWGCVFIFVLLWNAF